MMIEQILSSARQLAEHSRQDAIFFLKQFMDEEFFDPWGVHHLIAYLCDAGELDEARELNAALLDRHPRLRAAWSNAILLSRASERHSACIADILSRIRKEVRLEEEWFRSWFFECLFGAACIDQDFIDVGIRSGFLSPEHLKTITILLNFLEKIKAEYDHVPAARAESWTACFSGRPEAILYDRDKLHLNLSVLKLPGLVGVDQLISEVFIISVSSILNWLPFVDDDGISGWKHVTEDDAATAIFWRLLMMHRPEFQPGLQPAEIQPGDLWVRAGNVELFALWSYLHDPRLARLGAETATSALAEASTAGRDLPLDPAWWPLLDAHQNIAWLISNAGWYAKTDAGGCFADWAERYRDALCAGKLFDLYAADLLRIAPLLPQFRHQAPHAWNEESFLALLDGADIIFVTAYAREIAEHEARGGLRAVWNELGIKAAPRSLTTIQAPVSVWPHQPDENWSASFAALDKASKRAMAGKDKVVFLAACGCYGLPLVHSIHREARVTSVHCGHMMNYYFGIYTNDFKNLPAFERGVNGNWITPIIDEDRMGLMRVDDGRYVV